MDDALRTAIRNGDDASVRRVTSRPDELDALGPSNFTALMLAAEYDQPSIMALLLELGAHPDVCRDDGWTALHHAVDAECDAEVQGGPVVDGRLIRVLLAARASPDCVWQSPDGPKTPRDIALDYRSIEAVALLLAQ